MALRSSVQCLPETDVECLQKMNISTTHHQNNTMTLDIDARSKNKNQPSDEISEEVDLMLTDSYQLPNTWTLWSVSPVIFRPP